MTFESSEFNEGLTFCNMSPEIAMSHSIKLRYIVDLYNKEELSWDSVIGTIIDIIDDSMVTAQSMLENEDPDPVEGGLAHFTLGYIYGLGDGTEVKWRE